MASAAFVAGAVDLSGLPESSAPEVAFIGRSNVGKSTLLNRLAQQDKLARTSATPGRTQQLNIFALRVINPADKSKYDLHLIDLPGFGYAKFSKEMRESLSGLTVEYISSRPQLQVVCLLADCRRDPAEDELAVRDLALRSGRSLPVIVT
ncbi:MAG: ribosome biogenesis GTP-binding protein YsxC, partial [Deltaproteobacteria bacterium]|nr:ribosome biogenesis GTP-binding protein YsxC [Deltaproteobacteria bacterium]